MKHYASRLVAILALALVTLSGCNAPPVPTATGPACQHEITAPRGDLDRTRWFTADGKISWPQDDGFVPPSTTRELPPGTLLDRFGDLCGGFFSPQGEAYAARALPYSCMAQSYTVFRVLQPLPVKAGKAAAWFDEPGGAEQYQTAEPADVLLQHGVIAEVLHDPPGIGAAERPCDGRAR